MKCYEVKNCPMCGCPTEEAKCQSYKLQISCYNYDWVSLYNSFPDSQEKIDWKNFMLSKCPNCVVFQKYPTDVKAMLKKLIET